MSRKALEDFTRAQLDEMSKSELIALIVDRLRALEARTAANEAKLAEHDRRIERLEKRGLLRTQ